MNVIKRRTLPHMKRPCENCPFTTYSMEGWLGKARMEEILASPTFVCHKRNDLQCAGHMIIKGDENDFVQLAGRLNMPLKLTRLEFVFETMQQCVEHHT